jgi:hypothetical protein
MNTVISYLALFLFLCGLGAGFYFYYQDTQYRIETMASDISTLKIATDEQGKTINQLIVDSETIKVIAEKIEEAQKISQQVVSDLEKTFRKMTIDGPRDIGNLAEARPESIERIINNGTDKVFRCMEISTGSILTEEERKEYDETGKLRDCPGTVIP